MWSVEIGALLVSSCCGLFGGIFSGKKSGKQEKKSYNENQYESVSSVRYIVKSTTDESGEKRTDFMAMDTMEFDTIESPKQRKKTTENQEVIAAVDNPAYKKKKNGTASSSHPANDWESQPGASLEQELNQKPVDVSDEQNQAEMITNGTGLSMDEKMRAIASGRVQYYANTYAVMDVIGKAISMAVVSPRILEGLLQVDGSEELTVDVDLYWTAQAIANLIKNSMEHTKLNGAIDISFGVRDEQVVLYIKDNGEGVLLMDLPRICDIYYKGKGVGNEHQGIGLTMAKQIVTQQGGTLEVASKYGQGTCIKIAFPRTGY